MRRFTYYIQENSLKGDKIKLYLKKKNQVRKWEFNFHFILLVLTNTLENGSMKKKYQFISFQILPSMGFNTSCSLGSPRS